MSWIAAGAQILSQVIGGVQNRNAMRRERKYNRQMMQEMNQYNSPKSQMQRLEEAGLNPNLIYGSGSAATGTQTQPATGEFSNVPTFDPGAALGAYVNTEAKTTDIKYAKRKIETEEFNAALLQTKTANLQTDGQIRQLEFTFLNDTLDDRRKTTAAQAMYNMAMSVVAQKHAEWTRQGMNPNDATWLRLMSQYLKGSTGEIDENRGKFQSVFEKYLQGNDTNYNNYFNNRR